MSRSVSASASVAHDVCAWTCSWVWLELRLPATHFRSKALVIMGVLFFALGGCSRDGPPLLSGASERLPPPLSEAERARWRTIGVTLPAATPETGFDTWFRGSRADGAIKGVLEGLFVGGAYGGLFGGGVGVIGGAAGGMAKRGVDGFGMAVPNATAEEIDAFVAARFNGQALGLLLRERVIAAAGREAGLPVTLLDSGPAQTSVGDCSVALAPMTVLELKFTGYGFAGDGGDDPKLAVVLGVKARIVDAETCDERHAVALTYVGAERNYSDWRMDAATTLQNEIDHGVNSLAEEIVEELFLLYLPGDASRKTTDKVTVRSGAVHWG